MEKLLVRFTRKQRAAIRRLSRKWKMSEAEVVRFALEKFLALPKDEV